MALPGLPDAHWALQYIPFPDTGQLQAGCAHLLVMDILLSDSLGSSPAASPATGVAVTVALRKHGEPFRFHRIVQSSNGFRHRVLARNVDYVVLRMTGKSGIALLRLRRFLPATAHQVAGPE